MSRRAPNPAAERAAQNQATIKSLLKLEANKVCSDCKRNKHPRWASWNLGVFICIRCSGIHRGMGTHISRVKSVDLDSWTDEQLQSVLNWGNARANKYWEAKLAAGHAPSEAKIENFIRTKYELKRWVMDGPMPDPATLDADGDDDVPLSIVKEKQTIERKESIRKASLGNSSAPKPMSPPQGDLIGGDPVPVRSSSAAPHAAKVPPKGEPAPPRATSGKDSLLGLDFFGEPQAPPRPASTTGTAPSGQSRPDLKQSILSLYASAPRPQAQAQPQQPSSAGGFGGLASPTFSHQSQGSMGGGFNDAFSSLSVSSNAPKPAAPDPFASLSTAGRTTSSSSNAFGGLGGGSFFDSKPSQPAAPTHQHQSSNFSNFGGFPSPAPAPAAAPTLAAPKPAQSSAMGDLFDLSAPVTTSAPPPQPAAASTSSVFNLSSPQSPPAAAPATTTTSTMGSFSGADVWGGSEWGAPAAAAAPMQKAPEPPKPAANDFGWGNTGGAFANTPIVPGASGGLTSGGFNPISSPKVSADEEFGGWASSGPAATGSTSQAKSSGGFGGDDDLFSNVWQ